MNNVSRPLAVLALAGLVFAFGCPSPSQPADGGPALDAGLDAGEPRDAGLDAGRPRDAGDPDAGDARDAGLVDAGLTDGGAHDAPDLCDVVDTLFIPHCVGCHQPGQTAPDLTRDGAAAIVDGPSMLFQDTMLVVPFDPQSSLLWRKVHGVQSPTEGAVMPIGVARENAPIGAAAVLEPWINAGAPTTCRNTNDAGPGADAGMPSEGWEPGPNALDQDALFTCTGESQASPGRIRRIERAEWAHAIGKPLTPTWYGSTARNNPFHVPGHLPYSTYSEGVTIDASTLDLYMAVLPEAGSGWTAPSGTGLGKRTYHAYNDRALRCMWSDAVPDDTCIVHFADTYLRKAVLFRPPSTAEHARFEAFLRTQLLRETALEDRPRTLSVATQGAWLTTGALFRPELGAGLPDAAGDVPLSPGELGRALGGLLSTFPPGASAMFDFNAGPPEHEHWTAPPEGYLGDIASAVADGTISDPVVRATLLAAYYGGTEPARYDLQLEYGTNRRDARGADWLAPRVAGFFREWLDYSEANTIFKDTPRATSQWHGQYSGNPMYDPITRGWINLQHAFYGSESTLVQQLDDTIARVVVADQNVLATLLTTREWHLASTLAQSNGMACMAEADCTDAAYPRCTAAGVCGNSISTSTVQTQRAYNLTGHVPNTREGRWVTLPANERAGVLTHPAWLAAHGGNFEDDASAIHRGKWVRENLLCEVVPPLSLVQVEAKLVPRAPDLSARDRIVASTETGPDAATCTGCHARMNSLGYPFEVYNHAGFVRASDHGAPPNGQSTITNAPDPALNTTVQDAVEFSALLAGSPHVKRCFLRHAFRYFMGRDERPADACTLSAMETAYDQGGSFRGALTALAQSRAFTHRVPAEVTP